MGRRIVKVFGWLAGLLAVIIVLGIGLIYVVLQTQPGHDFVLRTVLSRAVAYVDGELRVGALRSDGLLRGFTLHEIAIRDDRGRPFLSADSIRVRYSWRELLGGRIALIPARAWGPQVVLETLHGDEHSNLQRIFRLTEPPEAREEPTEIAVMLRNVEIHDGEFLLRTPLETDEAPPRMVVESVPGTEGLYRRFHFTDIQALLEEADVVRLDEEGERLVFQRLALTGQIFEDPFVLEEFRGVVERVGSRLMVDAERFWLPESELSGELVVDWGDPERGMELDLRAEATVIQLADLRWVEPRLPDGEGRLDLSVEGPVAESRWRITDADLRVGPSRIRGDVGFDLAGGFRLAETDLEAVPLYLEQLEPWLAEPLPVEGRIQGRVRATGPFQELRVDGQVTYDDPEREIPASSATVAGVLVLDDPVGVRELSVEVDPLRYRTLRAFAPELELEGVGTVRAELSGALSTGLRMVATVAHQPEGEEGGGPVDWTSRLQLLGSVRDPGDGLRVDLQGRLEPLSLDGLALGLGRELPVRGELSGPVEVSGVLSDLQVVVDLATPAGRLAAQGRFDALEPGRRYRVQGRVDEFALDRLLDRVPDSTVVSGDFLVDGSGLEPAELAGHARLNLAPLTVAGVELDRADAVLRVENGVLTVDTLEMRSVLGDLTGTGTLALREDAPEGEILVTWDVPSLARLRPLILGEDVIAGDTLGSLERLALEVQGIDPDTLPSQADVAMDGRARGELVLRGALQDLEGEGFVEVVNALYGDLSLAEGRADGTGRWQGRDAWTVRGVLDLDQIDFGRYRFERIDGEVAYGESGEGNADLHIFRNEEESYRLAAAFAADSIGVEFDVASMDLHLGPVEWTLDEPARVRVEGRTIQVDRLSLSRTAGPEGISSAQMRAEGVLALDGTSDFQVAVQGMDINRVAGILQIEHAPSGLLDFELAVVGPDEALEMDGEFLVLDLVTGTTSLSRVEGSLEYRDRLARTRLTADMNGRRLLTAEGSVPVDLSFASVEDRLPDRNVDLRVEMDSLPASTLLAFVGGIDGVEGTLDGYIDLRGPPRTLQPSGEIRMQEGSVELPELGVRIGEISGDLRVLEDRTVEVSAQARARGTASVEGTISMEDLTDPGFDLRINAAGFQAVDRRDLNARVGGQVTLTGSYTRPQVSGQARVEQGSIFLEEFARSAEVVDLTDPSFFDVVDTTLVAARPVLAAAQNPFVQNLRVDVDLVIQRDFWLRSREMNVEMGGELIVTFDRPRREILLIGSLEAMRGSYTAFGRNFQVRQGTVEFVGTPGIDPSLDIEAVHRLRREGGEPLNVVANVGGTLMNLRVDLSSDAQPAIAESDLISYLIFGRPSYALASGESSVLEGAAGVGVSVGLGAVAQQLGTVVARQFGVDYFTITQTREGPGLESMAGLGGSFADTQIEVGQYVGQDLFLALILRPLTGLGARTTTQFPGARLEWRFTDLWTAEAFVEDRFAREAASGFGELGLRLDKVLGFSLYREWGY